jgi:hypothetical protein
MASNKQLEAQLEQLKQLVSGLAQGVSHPVPTVGVKEETLTPEQVRASAKLSGKKIANVDERGGSIMATVRDGAMHIQAGLDKPWVRSGKNEKTGETWSQILYASTIKSRFLKTIRVVDEETGTAYRVQVEVKEELPK